MNRQRDTRLSWRGSWALGLLLVVGCSRRVDDTWTRMRPPVFPANGIVIYQGKPVAGATVMLESQSSDDKARGKVAIGHTDSGGRFRVRTYKEYEGAVAGPHRVSVTKFEYVENKPANADPNIDYPLIPKPLLPERYKDFATSGLTATVTEQGPNSFRLQLEE
jgi:hypothetical protein